MGTTLPKVFISYSWAQNNERVLNLADRLLSDGVEVVIDECDFKEGNDKFAFMERCVVQFVGTDPAKALKNKGFLGAVPIGSEAEKTIGEIADELARETSRGSMV